MLDIARIHAYRKTNNEFFIFDVPRYEAKRKKGLGVMASLVPTPSLSDDDNADHA